MPSGDGCLSLLLGSLIFVDMYDLLGSFTEFLMKRKVCSLMLNIFNEVMYICMIAG